MTEKCPICKEYLWEWKSPHYCDPIFYVWEAEGGGTFTDAYDLNGRIFAKDAEEAATAYFRNDFERSEIEVYVLSDKDAEEIINDLSECDQTKEEIARLNDVANKLADCYTLTAEVVREVSAKLKTKVPVNVGGSKKGNLKK